MNVSFKIEGKTIENKRLILRSFKQSDLNDFYEYASVDGVGEMAGWKHHENIQETQMILSTFIENDDNFAICLKDTNKVIGSIGIIKYNDQDLIELTNYRGLEIGFVLSKQYWGKGIMVEAVKLIIDFLFNEENIDFIVCTYYNSNNQSKRVQEKCGFKYYKEKILETSMGEKLPGVINILFNPKIENKVIV